MPVRGVIPWRHVLPKSVFMESFKRYVTDLSKIEELFSSSDYPSFFLASNKLFDNLQRSKVDTTLLRKLLKSNDSHVLRHMLSGSVESFLEVPTYDRTSTKTGRLTIKKGPQVLTLKREFRSIFTPTKSNRVLFEIDFISLEPRVALNFANVHASNDVYLSFLESSGIKVSRDTAKLAVLCSLYGAGNLRLERLLQKESANITARYLMKAVTQYFRVADLKHHLFSQAREGLIQNYFGRPIEIDDARESILINNYLQSTAADVAIAGFNDFAKRFAGKCRPLFVIHDALVIDVDIEYLEDIKRYVTNGYNVPNLGNFPLKIKEFSNHE
jgi:DNA polymerase I-like protein with 3'-5' exonuclease and polymerase domains